MNRKLEGFLEVLFAGIGFGFLGIFGKLSFNSGLTVGELLTFRFLTAGVLLFVYLLITDRSRLKLEKRQIIISCLPGVFGYAVFSTLYFKSLTGVSVALAAMLLFTFPIFVNLGAHFFLKHRMNQNQLISLILAILGLIVLLWGDLTINHYSAVLMGLGAGLTYAIYVLVSGQVQKNVYPLSSSLYVITSAGLALFAYHQPSLARVADFTLQQLSYIIGIAIICTIGPLTLFLIGLQKMSSSKASIIVMIEPVTAAIAAYLILGESMGLLQLIGSALIFIALYMNTLPVKNSNR